MTSRKVQNFKTLYIESTHPQLKEMRESAGHTQESIAQRCGVTMKTWAKYENGLVPFPGYLRQVVFDVCGQDPQPPLVSSETGTGSLRAQKQTVIVATHQALAGWRDKTRDEYAIFLSTGRIAFLRRHNDAIHSSALGFALATLGMSFFDLKGSFQIGALTYHEWLFLFCFAMTAILASYQMIFWLKFSRCR